MYLGCTRIILMYTANLKNQEKNGKTVKFAKKYKIDTILILFNPLGPVSLSRLKKKNICSNGFCFFSGNFSEKCHL